jgi:diguanylate cyclase (GGDEF)-like protein
VKPTISRDAMLGPSARVAALAGVIAAAAIVVYSTAVAGAARPAGIAQLPWWALGLLFFLAEAYPVHLHFRREAHSLSLSDVALVLGLFMTDPGGVVLAQIVGAGLAILLVRRQRPIKIMFNLAQFALSSSVAVALFHLVVEHGSAYGFAGWLGSLSAAGVSALISAALVAAVMRLVGSRGSARELAYVAAVGAVASFASASLGVAAVEVVRADVRAVWVLAIPVLACAVALHAYTRQRRRHQHLEFLYRSMRAMQSAPELHSAVRELLGAARTLLSAEFAEVVLLPMDECETILRGTVSATGEPVLEPVALDQSVKLALEVVAAHEGATLLPRGRERHALDTYLASREISDAVVSIVRGEDGVGGMILVGERAGDVETFTNDDAKLLETFANHAAVVLESGQVREQLRYQAFHDPLTGLPNRFLFADRVAEALAQHRSRPGATTVLFLDLDDFKTINDSLGHGAGDDLLVAVAERLQACSDSGAVASRLGGDEFAVLLPAATPAQAEAFAIRLLDAFNDFFTLHSREITIHPSIGIAAADGSATTAEELLRNADVAMYTAKSNGKRSHAFYEPEMHTRAKRRQELASALERALERSEICVHYQPIVELGSGAVFGFEALARWHHPDHGLLPAGSFIPLAEETGLATGIGRVVLRAACEQLAEWQRTFGGRTPLVMSVNLAPLELQNPHLVDEVEAALQTSGLSPDTLMLEITEGMALRDPHTTVERLRGLRQLGVRIALDDFGTGYSSLSHLRDLPIDVLKIAKPFVDSLSPTDEPFVKAMIQIAEALELLVVAEGIEHPQQAEILRLLDCNLGQGYHYSRPLDPASAERYLRIAGQQAWREAQEHSRANPRRHRASAAISR